MEPAPPTDCVVCIADVVPDNIIEKIDQLLEHAVRTPEWKNTNFVLVRGENTWIRDCEKHECGTLLADITTLIYGNGEP